jgi:hypothetical protein
MIVQVWEGGLQAGAHAKPGFLVDRLRDSVAELKIICEHGVCILKITLLDGIHEGLYSLSFIHNISFTTNRANSKQVGLGINGCSL